MMKLYININYNLQAYKFNNNMVMFICIPVVRIDENKLQVNNNMLKILKL